MGVLLRGGPDACVVVCSHLPGEGHFESDRFQVIGAQAEDDFGYWAGVAAHWGSPQTLVLVEHDVEVTDEHIAALLDCPHDACAWACRCHWWTSRIAGGVLGAGGAPGSDRFGGDHLTGGEEFAGWSAPGLVKLTPVARVSALRCEPWQRVEIAVHDAVARPWHMHWPEASHHHW